MQEKGTLQQDETLAQTQARLDCELLENPLIKQILSDIPKDMIVISEGHTEILKFKKIHKDTVYCSQEGWHKELETLVKKLNKDLPLSKQEKARFKTNSNEDPEIFQIRKRKIQFSIILFGTAWIRKNRSEEYHQLTEELYRLIKYHHDSQILEFNNKFKICISTQKKFGQYTEILKALTGQEFEQRGGRYLKETNLISTKIKKKDNFLLVSLTLSEKLADKLFNMIKNSFIPLLGSETGDKSEDLKEKLIESIRLTESGVNPGCYRIIIKFLPFFNLIKLLH